MDAKEALAECKRLLDEFDTFWSRKLAEWDRPPNERTFDRKIRTHFAQDVPIAQFIHSLRPNTPDGVPALLPDGLESALYDETEVEKHPFPVTDIPFDRRGVVADDARRWHYRLTVLRDHFAKAAKA